MQNAIFRPFTYGKETFHPKSYDEKSFVMDWSMRPKGAVPPHLHEFSDEHFRVTKGVVTFKVDGKTIVKNVGETLMVPKGTRHAIRNQSGDEIAMEVIYTPCADVHRLFEVLLVFESNNPGKMKNLLKYFYLAPRLGYRAFSTPQPPLASKIINGMVTLIGKFRGWDKHLKTFRDAEHGFGERRME